jgi:succinyl-CoA synthetase alpha subunit
LTPEQSIDLLREYNIEAKAISSDPEASQLLSLSVYRTARSPAIIVSPTAKEEHFQSQGRQIPFSYSTGPEKEQVEAAASVLGLRLELIEPIVANLWRLYRAKEAISLEVNINSCPKGIIEVSNPSLMFDDAAFRSNKRQADLHNIRDTSQMTAVELDAEPHGIVYVTLDGEERTIGTIVNGAGLAMNTVDALATHGLWATNFLDTGGKATSETVSQSFRLVLSDPRVKVLFVNIFGGLTLGDMIARGVLMAFKEVGVEKPVVVRIRGTNEKEGQRIIAESGLPLYAYEHFEEAAKKLKELIA